MVQVGIFPVSTDIFGALSYAFPEVGTKNTTWMCYTLLGVISGHEIEFETQIYTK
jgi:hypothetical protein